MWKKIAVVILPLLLAAPVVVPVWLDRPFSTQTTPILAAVYLLRRWSPVFAILGAAAMTALAIAGWRQWRHPLARIAVTLAWLAALAPVWFARQNLFEWKFNPLRQPRFVQADEATFVQPADLVLAVSVNGESVAYPIRQLAYHHVVNDVVGGVPLAATY
jgi:hypothetical protein